MSKHKKKDDSADFSDMDMDIDLDSDIDSLSSLMSSEEGTNKTAECIRKVSNFSSVKPHDILDKYSFNPEYLQYRLERASPKMVELLDRIRRLDEQDMKKHGTLFKHMIFSDQASSSYGAKLIASVLLANDFVPAFHTQGTGFHVLDDKKLLETKNNFGVLLSKSFYNRSISVHFKKALLDKFNRRPDNIHGDLIRFIVLDQGFKEGIDLFDVKYVHLMEPLINNADEKQAIGRGTRFCGQRGLTFHPTFGWPLYVFRYDVKLPPHLKANPEPTTMHELMLKYADIDFRKVMFAAEVEKMTIEGAVDHTLTSPIHGFSIPPPPPILQSHPQKGGEDLLEGGMKEIGPPRTKLSNASMKRYIETHFSGRFTYPEVKLENKCGGAPKKKGVQKVKVAEALPEGTLVQFTPSQDFIRHYFVPSSPYKGMLLWHSVGTGKTCTAIATATSGFEPEGYNILWVTRHTLKSDIFKNLFRQVCSLVLQDKLKKGEMTLPKNLVGPMKHLSDRWIEPISYKQFTNLLLKKNRFYDEMVKRNGKEDPLRKTLLIIDEAHKLYSAGVAASEKPNTDILEEMIQQSYRISGKNSVRLLVMTATPYTEDGMELVKLLNLMRLKEEAFPHEFDAFSKKYLLEDGTFSTKGKQQWLDGISGYVSYLNRSKDARNFSYPVLENVHVPMTLELDPEDAKKIPEDGLKNRIAELKDGFKDSKQKLRDVKQGVKKNLKEDYKDEVTKNKQSTKEAIDKCIQEIEELMEEEKALFEAIKIRCEEIHKERGHGKAKTECIKKAKDELTTKLSKLKMDKKDCKAQAMVNAKGASEIKEDLQDKMDGLLAPHIEEFQKSTEEYRMLKEKYDEYASMRKENNAELKELKPKYQELREALRELRDKVKKAKIPLKKLKSKADKKKLLEGIRNTVGAQLKKVHSDFMEIKEPITKLRIDNKILRIKQGATTVGDITQEKILNTKCSL